MNYYNGYYPQQQQQYNYNQYTPQQFSTINGKIVDSEDIVKVTDVPIGGYGVFPKADLSEIYAKVWNNNGTTSIIKFQPCQTSSAQQNPLDIILEKITVLERKLDLSKEEGDNKDEQQYDF